MVVCACADRGEGVWWCSREAKSFRGIAGGGAWISGSGPIGAGELLPTWSGETASSLEEDARLERSTGTGGAVIVVFCSVCGAGPPWGCGRLCAPAIGARTMGARTVSASALLFTSSPLEEDATRRTTGAEALMVVFCCSVLVVFGCSVLVVFCCSVCGAGGGEEALTTRGVLFRDPSGVCTYPPLCGTCVWVCEEEEDDAW